MDICLKQLLLKMAVVYDETLANFSHLNVLAIGLMLYNLVDMRV